MNTGSTQQPPEDHPAIFSGRLGILQRALPEYRAPFFATLADVCAGGLSLLAGQPLAVESMATAGRLQRANFHSVKNYHFLNPSSPFYLCWQSGVLAWLNTWQPDVLIIEANSRYLSSPRAVSWMHRRNRPVLGWGLGAPMQAGLPGRVLHLQRSGFLRNLDGVIAYSQVGAEQYQAAGIPPERIFIAYNAVSARPTIPYTARASLPQGARPLVLFVGRMQQRKRVDLLLRACAALSDSIQPRLWIVGDGPARDDMKNLAREIYPEAEFLGGRYGQDLDEIYAAADLFVLPGTGGLAIQQAMAHGLPVIAAEADGTQNDLVRPASGWQVPPGDLDALIRVMQEALGDLSRLRSKGREAYRIVAEDINLESMAASFVEAAQETLRLGLRL